MSKGSEIITFRISDVMLEEVVKAVLARNNRTADELWTNSDFIRVAIQDKLNHYSRSRGRIRGKRYQCDKCGDVVPLKEVAYVVRPLFGPQEVTCVMCERVKTSD